MKMKRFMCAIITFVLMLSTLLAGCGSAGDDAGDKIRLRISVFQAGEGLKWIEDLAAEYEKINPNVIKNVIKF